jgi:DNA-binding transcriptional regulator YhcF (GntR family)
MRDLTIDAGSAVPPYEQVRAQIAAQVANGDAPIGMRLPTVRALADTLGLAANTVARSYRELEAAGIVETRGRAGTVVAARGDAVRARVAAGARRYADLAHGSGVSAAEAIDIVTAAIADTRPS